MGNREIKAIKREEGAENGGARCRREVWWKPQTAIKNNRVQTLNNPLTASLLLRGRAEEEEAEVVVSSLNIPLDFPFPNRRELENFFSSLRSSTIRFSSRSIILSWRGRRRKIIIRRKGEGGGENGRRMDGRQTHHQWQAVNHSFTTRLYAALIRGSYRWRCFCHFSVWPPCALRFQGRPQPPSHPIRPIEENKSAEYPSPWMFTSTGLDEW